MYLGQLVESVNAVQASCDYFMLADGVESVRHVQSAIFTSVGATDLLLNTDAFWSDARRTMGQDGRVDHDPEVVGILDDPALFEMFLDSERRLLIAASMSTSAVDRLVVAMREKRHDARLTNVELLRENVGEVREILTPVREELSGEARDHVHTDRRRVWWRLARAAAEALGGAAAVGVDAAGALASLGLGGPAATVSASLGSVVFADGLSRMKRAE